MNQLDLFDEPTPYARGSATSRAAAESVEPKVTRQEKEVMAYIRSRGDGAACFEIEKGIAMKHETASARITGLHKKGMLRRTGEKRKTLAGNPADVHVAM